MKIRTIERNLVIRLPKEEDKTEGGIIKPEAVKAGRVVNRGVVVAVGPKVTDAAVGDTVGRRRQHCRGAFSPPRPPHLRVAGGTRASPRPAH